MSFNKSDYNTRMQGAFDALHKEFIGLRTGRASTNLLEPLMVDAYGSKMPMPQVGTINAPEARMLTVQVWDKELVKFVEKTIREAGLGLNPSVDGQTVRVPLPDLTEERRRELTKVAAKYAEQARIAVRNVRRDAMDMLKKLEKSSDISEDDQHRLSKEMQDMTDDFIKKIDEALTKKEADIMQV
jgi:ribosome recycling factor